ncbi:MAG: PDZ domain-containing protein, partial [Pseudomonadota bacterium]
THGAKSLDDAMRLALEHNPVERGFTPADFRAAASMVAGVDLNAWFSTTFDSMEELDYREALDWFGLRFVTEESSRRAWLGAAAQVKNGRLTIAQVVRGTPAYDAGLDTGDEIVGIGETHIRPERWERALENYRPGDRVSLLVNRRERLLHVPVTFGLAPEDRWNLEFAGSPAAEQSAHRRAWLTGR